jgi:hypothetical protein
LKYVIIAVPSAEASKSNMEDPEAFRKVFSQLMEQMKPEAIYFSITRRLLVVVVNSEDPHVEIRNVYEALSNYGEVTVDPVSSSEDFGRWIKQL